MNEVEFEMIKAALIEKIGAVRPTASFSNDDTSSPAVNMVIMDSQQRIRCHVKIPQDKGIWIERVFFKHIAIG